MSSRQARRRQQRVRQRGGRPPRGVTPWYLQTWALLGAGAAVVVVIIVIAVAGQANKPAASEGFKLRPAPPGVLSALSRSPASTVREVGTGSLPNPWTKETSLPPLTSGGKPELLYIGAEYCPYCGGSRWGLINALSRFGTFSGIDLMKSSSTDVFADTNTFTFRRASYTSKYLTFTTYENEDRQQKPLQAVPTDAQNIWTTFDPGQNFPFIDLANSAINGGVGTGVELLHAGGSATGSPLSWQEIASSLGNPSSQPAQLVYGSANWLTAGICKVTHNLPASACSNSTIQGLEKQVGF